jgi:DNA repair protein SbcC/Rad50
MRIKRVILENFRCFSHSEIDLSGDIVAIYGRNGVGKTAFFDALEFALLGSIGRFVKDSAPPFYLPNVLSDDNGMVHIDFKGDTDDWVKVSIDRTSNFDVHIDSSGGWRSRRDLLYGFLADENYSPPRREVSTIAELFRSTVLLAQHTIGQFVEGDAAERSRILSYLAGSGYIQRCLDKAKEVMKEAKKRERQEQSKLEETKTKAIELRKSAAEQDGRIKVIRERLGKGAISYDTLLKTLKSAGISIGVNLPITPEDVEVFSASVRSASHERILALDDRNKQLAQIEAMNLQHPDRLKRRHELHEMVEKARVNLIELLSKENNAAENLKDLDKRIREINLDISGKAKSFKALQMLPELQRQRTEWAKVKDNASSKIVRIQSELDLSRSNLEQKQTALDSAKKELAISCLKTEKASSKLEKLEALRASLPAYATAKRKINHLELHLNEIGGKRAALEKQITKLRDQHLKLDDRIGALNRKISGMKASSQEETDLIARLRQYATARECPMCGHTHHSGKALQDAIDARIKHVPVSLQETAKDLQNLSNKLAMLNANIEDFKNEIKGVDDDFHKTQSERDKEVLITHEMEAKAASLGTSLVLEEVKDSIDHSQTLLTTQRKTEERFNKANDQLNLAIVTTRSLEEALAVENEVYKKSQQELDSIELQFIELGLLNERQQTIDQLQVRVESVRTQLTELKIQKSNLEVAKRKAQNEWDSSRSERMKLEANLREWEETIGRLNAEIEDFQFKCKALALPIDASSEIIDRDRDLLTQDKEKLDAAIKMIQRYEWYIKVTTLESEREDLRGVISSIEKDMKEKTSKIEKFREVTNEAENWISALSESVNIAVRTKIDAHQPEIVRLFKAMIPCPYLFEKVTLKHEETGIRLGLRYRGQEKDAGEPRFFLSSAQANVLALSIFLSFAMDQNWSKLDTILLDDPVQHLDDLDAVAFLDNLRATALGKFGHRKQIVVSTCDKNLYLLMIRKFSLLEADGLHFTGISLLDKGFGGPEIIYDVGGPQGRRLLLRAV